MGFFRKHLEGFLAGRASPSKPLLCFGSTGLVPSVLLLFSACLVPQLDRGHVEVGVGF